MPTTSRADTRALFAGPSNAACSMPTALQRLPPGASISGRNSTIRSTPSSAVVWMRAPSIGPASVVGKKIDHRAERRPARHVLGDGPPGTVQDVADDVPGRRVHRQSSCQPVTIQAHVRGPSELAVSHYGIGKMHARTPTGPADGVLAHGRVQARPDILKPRAIGSRQPCLGRKRGAHQITGRIDHTDEIDAFRRPVQSRDRIPAGGPVALLDDWQIDDEAQPILSCLEDGLAIDGNRVGRLNEQLLADLEDGVTMRCRLLNDSGEHRQ